jgi:hypothetical protein
MTTDLSRELHNEFRWAVYGVQKYMDGINTECYEGASDIDFRELLTELDRLRDVLLEILEQC